VDVVGPERPQVGLVGEGRLCGGVVPQARPHPLGPSGGARGVVHGPGQRIAGQRHRRTGIERLQPGPVGDDQGRIGVGDQRATLCLEERGVQQHRHHADAQRTEDGAEQRRRRGKAEHHPVARLQAGRHKGPGGPALRAFGVRCSEDLHRHRPAHGSSVLRAAGAS
jgi:hypothetical protein